jgi:hypothetical protein
VSALRTALREIRAGLGEGVSFIMSAGVFGYFAYEVLNGRPLSIDDQAGLLSALGLLYFARGLRKARKAGRK